MVSLHKTLTHESIRRKIGRLDMIKRPFNHPDIYQEAANRTKDFFNNGGGNVCGCDK